LICELSIVVPTFNEINNIRPLVESLHHVLADHKWEVIFVDDDSPDGTASLLREISQQDEHVRSIRRLNRKGLASACIEGMLASSSPYIAVIDADMQHDESILIHMLEHLKKDDCDIAIGTRYVKGGSTGELSSNRVWISQLATHISRMVLKEPISDPMSGFFFIETFFF